MNIRRYFIFTAILSIILPAYSKDCNYIGCKYLGAEYVSDPLGEEHKPDTDPLILTDAFDCVTFVETSLVNGDKDNLQKIRYKDGKIDFLNRNHFIEYDWIRNNSNIAENTSELFGKTKIRNVTINKKKWFKKVHGIDTNFSDVKTEIKYIPYSDLKQVKTEKTLLILFIVDNPKMKNKIGTDLAVSHMGFLLPNGMLRHASAVLGKVVDVKFEDYVIMQKKNKINLGIALYKIK